MALPIILNLRRRRRRRAEHTERGLGLVDHADRLTETKTEGRREMKGEKLENGKDTKRKKKKKHTSNYKSRWQSHETDKEDAFIASKPRFSRS